MSDKIISYQINELNGKFNRVEFDFPQLNENEVLVKVAGCGVCHTDISFWSHGVKTRKAFPLTLGHEISGVVVAGATEWINQNVIVPAVLPCGECELCKRDRSNICQKQLMPGNDFDGGFATHIKVPHKFLCKVPDETLQQSTLAELAVIADAVTTPYQVIKKSMLEKNDLAIVIGVGGVGIFGALIAKIFDAKVVAIDIDDSKLARAKQNGADAILNVKDLDVKSIKTKLKDISKELGANQFCTKIYEMSGTKPGQELAFNLMSFASTVSIVGFTMDKLEVRLSNLMAFDSTLIGTWGCKPELYPEVVKLVTDGKLKIKDFVETFPLSQINEIFGNTLQHKYIKRSVLAPDEF